MSKKYLLVVLVIYALLVSACAPSANDNPVTLEPVNIQLSWIHEYSAAPFHVAVREGFFADQGLEANLLLGGFGEAGYIDPIQQIVDGSAEFGMSNIPSILEARNNGAAVVAVANIFQRSPLALMTLDTSIQSPNDMRGKSILVADGGARRSLEQFLGLQNIALDEVTIVPRTDFGVEPLVNGEADILVAWVINEGVSLQEQGLEPRIFLMSDYGVDNYDFVLVTSEQIVNENPELVQKLVNAIHFGLDFTFNNAQAAIQDTLSFAPDLDVEAQLRRLEVSIPLMKPTADDVGDMEMNPEVWTVVAEQMVINGILPDAATVSEAFTNQFAQASSDLEN